ncbi:Antitoxin YefM [Roseovarius mucosus DSM 17069]|uniref:Antitoxin n=1 Tax=Roseovarius mucosus DSM 17069 TaxID=1288298 RepID=A0A0A0HK17_9RHOB|nr:type II toxin-antitoxin system Phd/YefM family antitoxin [Roseovarius mucosus]KGM87525.1 Antitoxin YefM [Roseovarius mucosus DSM 17069]
MYDEMPINRVRTLLRRVVDHLATGGQRVMVLRNGVPVAGLVSVSDLKALETADQARMEHHALRAQARLRDIGWLKAGLDSARYEVRARHGPPDTRR